MKKIFLFTLLSTCLFAACKPAATRSTSVSDQLVVLSYNIHHANPPGREAGYIDLDTIAATIRASGADLVAVQELDSVTNRSNRQFQLKILAEKLGMQYRFERTIPYGGGAYGIGILSRLPIEDAMSFALPNIEGVVTEPRKMLLVKLNWMGKPLYFGCTHFDFKNKDVKLAQAKAMMKYLEPFKGSPLIVAGDFNAIPTEESIRHITAGLLSTGRDDEFTIPQKNPTKKIDYIFYDTLQFVSGKVLTEASYGSDHLPVKAVFRF